MEHVKWFKSLPGGPSITAAARDAGIQKTTLMRQLDRGVIPAENVIKLCRAFGKPVADGLVETGYMIRKDFEGAGVADALGRATNQQIIDEIAKRLSGGMGEEFSADAEIVPMRYAADGSDWELEPGDEGYHDGP